MQWERVSETQRIEKIREYRDSPWSPSKAKRQPGFDQSQLFHPSILGSGRMRSLRQAPGSFDAPARDCRKHFATGCCLRFVKQVLERICLRHGDPFKTRAEVFYGDLCNS